MASFVRGRARSNLHGPSTPSKDLETPELTKRKVMPGPGFGPGFGGPFGPGPGLMVRRSPFAFLSVGHDPTAFALGPSETQMSATSIIFYSL